MFLSGLPRHLLQTRNGCESIPELLLPHQQFGIVAKHKSSADPGTASEDIPQNTELSSETPGKC